MEAGIENTSFSPPYISWMTLEHMLDRMRTEGVPSRIDRSYLASWSGSAQAQFLKAARSLDLLDEYGRPSNLLKNLVADADGRPPLVGQMIERKYPEARALGTDATQAQLEEVFRSYAGISGATVTKAIGFYLAASRYAGLPLSPFFRHSRGSSANGTSVRRRARPRKHATAETPPKPDSSPNPDGADAEQRKAYIDLLLEKAKTEGDTDLYARIEWLLGFRSAPPDGPQA